MSSWHTEETYKSLIQISTSGLRVVLVANGAAAIAILAFLGDANERGVGVAPWVGAGPREQLEAI